MEFKNRTIKIGTLLFLVNFLQAQQIPFYGTPFPIPGVIEAEDFDNGGEGVAYHDSDDINEGPLDYRTSGVDIETSGDTGSSPNVGWINADEWLEYTVNVQTTGYYNLAVRVASASAGGTFHIEFDGLNVTGPVSFGATGDWQVYTTINISDMLLYAGQKVMRFYMETSGFNVNYTDITLQNAISIPSVAITSPEADSIFYLGQDVTIYADASDTTASVSNVEFYANDILIGQDLNAPYQITWKPLIADRYDLQAVAVSETGGKGYSDIVDIIVNLPVYENEIYLSSERGFYDAPFTLTINGDTASNQVIYTLDGSNPESSPSAQTTSLPANIAINPQSTSYGRGTSPGVVIRVFGAFNGMRKTDIETHSYIFINEVPGQDYPGSPWPDLGEMGGQDFRYYMDQNVLNDPTNGPLIDESLLDIPSISLVMEQEDFWGLDSGIYVNAQYHGIEWERPVSAELINPDQSAGFQIDCGIRIRGGYSRHDNYPKHAFRLFFRRRYGPASLIYPLFEDEGVDEFKKVDIRASQNYSWANYQDKNTMVRDVFSRDIQGAMGQPYTRSRIYHLYVNGLYFGLFQTQERADANFAESYLGGNDDDYDVVKVDIGDDFNLYDIEATDGNLDGWKQVWDKTQTGFTNNTDYFNLQGKNADGTDNPLLKNLVDIDNLIDYLIVIFYTGNFDAPVSKFKGERDPNNFYAIYNRDRNEGFKFLTHDSEHSMFATPIGPGDGLEENRVNLDINVSDFYKFHPYWLHKKLAENNEYRILFADKVYKHLYNDGVLRQESVNAFITKRADELQLAIIAESARWGNTSRDKNLWLDEVAEITDEFIPGRSPIFFNQLKEADLYPDIEPPVFRENATNISTSIFQAGTGFSLQFVNPNSGGTIYYTLDGTDPREIGGSVSAGAASIANNGTFPVNAAVIVKARVQDGSVWSALHELNISVTQNLNDLIISEFHYHPLDEGTISGKEYEFIELKNEGSQNLNLSLISFVKGIRYTFPSGTVLGPGGYIVLASNATRFKDRYAFDPFDEFEGQLDNNGEKIVLVDSDLDTLVQIRYYDSLPWPVEADGQGYSLEWTNGSGDFDTNNPLNWAISANINGTPQQYVPVPVSIEDVLTIPEEFKLFQNYPNPFNPLTTIRYQLGGHEQMHVHVDLAIYNILGQKVVSLVDKEQAAGNYSIEWNASGFASGVYLVKLHTGNGFNKIRKILFLK